MPDLPWIRGAFRHVLHPPGMSRARQQRPEEQWYINDHCFLVDEAQRIHWFGITNPYPTDGRGPYALGSHRHIGHAVAQHPFGPWEERPHALALPEGAQDSIGACFVAPSGSEFLMFYGKKDIGFLTARSPDLDAWQNMEDVLPLSFGKGTRDPCVLQLEDGTYLFYGAAGCGDFSAVVLAESRDLLRWTPREPALLTDIRCPWGALESPFVHRRGEDYYLFVNHSHRQYEETLVFHSTDPRRFDWAAPLCTLFAHAAEVFAWGGQTYISHCGIEDRHWSNIGAPYGLWLAELDWVTVPADGKKAESV